MTVGLSPIDASRLDDVAAFLTAHLNPRVPPQTWVAAVSAPWSSGPDHGVMLTDEDRVVGAYLTIHSEREVDGVPRRFCNLAAWCVLPEYRFHSLKMVKALLRQDGVVLTDFSPSGSVVPLNRRLGFTDLDTATVVVPNLPWPSLPGRTRVVTDPARIAALLDGPQQQVHKDLAEAGAARHVVLRHRGRTCYVIYRRDRRKGLPLFASVLYVSDPDVFRSARGAFLRHLLLRNGIPATLMELRVVRDAPATGRRLAVPRPKMFRGEGVRADQIDYLYSELTCVSW